MCHSINIVITCHAHSCLRALAQSTCFRLIQEHPSSFLLLELLGTLEGVVQFNSASSMKPSITSPTPSVISASYKLTGLLCHSYSTGLLTVIAVTVITSPLNSYLIFQLCVPCLLHYGISFSSAKGVSSLSFYYLECLRCCIKYIVSVSVYESLSLLQLFLVRKMLASTG